jgi:hypothetical protein
MKLAEDHIVEVNCGRERTWPRCLDMLSQLHCIVTIQLSYTRAEETGSIYGIDYSGSTIG